MCVCVCVHMYIYNLGELRPESPRHGNLTVAGLTPRRHWLDPRSVYTSFVVDKVTLQRVCIPVLRFSPVTIILALLHTPS
jgi:hypothetical protein